VNRAYRQERSGERRREPYGRSKLRSRKGFAGNKVREAFLKRRDELLGDKCARCGKKTLTNDHPLKYCRRIAKCEKCGGDSHMTQYCARSLPRGASNQMYQCTEEDSEGPSDYEDEDVKDDVNYAGDHEPEWDQAAEPEDSEDEQVNLAREIFMEIDPTEDKKTDDVAHSNEEADKKDDHDNKIDDHHTNGPEDIDEVEDEEDEKHDDLNSDYVEEQNLLKALCKSVRESLEQKKYSADKDNLMKNSATRWTRTIREYEDKKGWTTEEEMDTAWQL